MKPEEAKKSLIEIFRKKKNEKRKKISQIINNISSLLESLKNEAESGITENDFEIVDKIETKTIPDTMPRLLLAVREMDKADTQKKILKILVKELNEICGEYYFFVLRGEKMVLWEGKSKTLSKEEMSLLSIPFSLDTSLSYVINSGRFYEGPIDKFSNEDFLIKKLSKSDVKKILLFPLTLKGKAVAVLYIDETKSEIEHKPFIEILMRYAGLSIDILPIKSRITEKLKEKQKKAPDEETTKIGVSKIKPPEKPKIEPEKEEIADETVFSSEEHKHAERLARVIVSDLLIYNGDKIEKGIEKGNIYNEIKDELEQAASHFYSKVDEKIWRVRNYFEKYLIEKLAGGNKNLLKGFKFRSV